MIDALVECRKCGSRELAQLTLDQYRTLVDHPSLRRPCARCSAVTVWGFALIEAKEASPSELLGTSPSLVQPSGDYAEQRTGNRLTVRLPLRVRLEDGREEPTGTENLSKTGVSFISGVSMKPGEVLYLTVGDAESGKEPEVPAQIVWRRGLEGNTKFLYGVRLLPNP